MSSSTGEASDEPRVPGRPAHRPSRRAEIIQSATTVFSRMTYPEATVEDIAEECDVAPTAIYYHFGSKEDLFDQVFDSCLAGFSAVVDAVRSSADELTVQTLRDVINAGWSWWRTHPVEARFLTLHLNGATAVSRRSYLAWQDHHARRAFDYLPAGTEEFVISHDAHAAQRDHAERLLGLQLVSAVLPITQSAWLDGALGNLPVGRLETALADMLVPIIQAGVPAARA
jgi:AcrR family transcriptional regulator